MIMHIVVTHIDFDLNEEDLELGDIDLTSELSFDINVYDDDDIDEVVADTITDITGYLINGCEYFIK